MSYDILSYYTLKTGDDILPSILEQTNAIEEYLNGDTMKQIGDRYGVSDTAVRNFLKKHQVPIETNRYYPNSKYTFDTHWLDELDCEEKFYFLGFFAADGNVDLSHGNYRARIKIQRGDRTLLERFNELLQNTRPVEDGEEKSREKWGRGDYIEYYSILHLGNRPFCERLIELGMVPNKSLILEFPDYVLDEYLRHFVRGFFDGDGSISLMYSPNNKTARATITFACGSRTFLEVLKEKLKEAIGIYSEIKPKSGPSRSLDIDRMEDIIPFLNWMYEDAHIYLQRKYDRYIELITHRDITKEDNGAKHRRLIKNIEDILYKDSIGISYDSLANEYGVSKKTIIETIHKYKNN